jgi:hypothetical protein
VFSCEGRNREPKRAGFQSVSEQLANWPAFLDVFFEDAAKLGYIQLPDY